MENQATLISDKHGGVSKRERYDWKVVDKPGEFVMLKKTDLKVDHSYQRKHSHAKILKMAREWSWVAFGAIGVAIRGDDWYVLDGQHRVLAAMMRDDVDELPCMVFEVHDVATEAKGFLRINTARHAMSMTARFKALLMTEDHCARVVNELVLSAGRVVASGGASSSFAAVQVALHCAKEDEQAMRRIWPVIVAVCGPDKRITQTLLSGLWYLERHLHPGESLASSHWKNRLVKVGYNELSQSIDQAAAFYGAGKGFKVCAIGIVKAINKGLRNHLTHRIKTDDNDES